MLRKSPPYVVPTGDANAVAALSSPCSCSRSICPIVHTDDQAQFAHHIGVFVAVERI